MTFHTCLIKVKIGGLDHAILQKTEPMEGYHSFHAEDNSWNNRYRVLAWMVYLNDVAEGGETEFVSASEDQTHCKHSCYLAWIVYPSPSWQPTDEHQVRPDRMVLTDANMNRFLMVK